MNNDEIVIKGVQMSSEWHLLIFQSFGGSEEGTIRVMMMLSLTNLYEVSLVTEDIIS